MTVYHIWFYHCLCGASSGAIYISVEVDLSWASMVDWEKVLCWNCTLKTFGCYSATVLEQSIMISLSVCLSIHEHISGTDRPLFTKFVVQIFCGCGSIFLWRRCETLCTSGFMDDVTFGRSGPYGDAQILALQYRDGVWCLWMPCLWLYSDC